MPDELLNPPLLRDIYKSEQFASSDLEGKHAIIDRWSAAKKDYGISIGAINSEEKLGIFDKKTADQKELFSMVDQMERANEPGFIEERANAVKRSFLSTSSALNLQSSKNATMEINLLKEEEKRLLDGTATKTVQDPESMEGVISAPYSHEEGMERLAEVQRRIGEVQNSGVAAAGVALEEKRAAGAIPRSRGMQEFMDADGFAASAEAFKENFGVVIMDAVLESSAALVAPVAGGAVAGPGGAFAGGASVEFVHSFQEFIEEGAKEKGLDPNDPEQLFLAMADKDLLDDAATRAMIRGGVIGSVDMFTLGMGKLISKKLAGKAIAEPAARAGFNLVGDPAGGSAGELAAQVAAGQEIDGKDIFLEGIGQFGTGAAGTIKDLGPKLPGAALKATGKAAVGTYGLTKGALNAASGLYGKIKGNKLRTADPEIGMSPEPNAENPVTPQDWTLAYIQGRFENAGAWITAMPGETAAELMPIVGISIDETNQKIADIVSAGNIEGNQKLADLQESLASMQEMMGALETALEEPEATTAEPEPATEPEPTVEPEPTEPESTPAEEPHGTVSSGKPNGAKVKFRYKLVEREDLEKMVVTEIGEDQTRNRDDNKASAEQVEKIATGIDPTLLTENNVASSGAPVVDGGTVISGNGRSLGIAEAYKRELANGYKESIEAFAAEQGLDTSGFKEPVLIREVQEFESGTREQFVEESNPKRGGLGESVSEQALLDAKAIGEETLAQLTFTANGDLTADSVAAVAQKLEEASRGVTRSTKGKFDKSEATRRVMAAYLSKMVQQSGRDASEVSTLLETDGGKRAVSAAAASSHQLGQMDEDLSLAEPLMDALMEFKSGTQAVAKRQFKNITEWYDNRKQELLATELDSIAEDLLSDMVNGEIREGLADYVTEAQVEQKERDISKDTEDIFGDERQDQNVQTIFDKSREIAERRAREQDTTGDLPGSESETEGEAAGGSQVVNEDSIDNDATPIVEEEEAPIDTLDPNEEPIHKFTLGAVVQLAKMLGLDPTVNPRLRNAYGRFIARSENGKIVPEAVETAEGLFLDPVKALNTLAHEVGHFIDYTVAHATRGTIPTKLAPLSKRNWEAIFPELKDQTVKQVAPAIEKEMAAEEKRQIENVKEQKQFENGENADKLAAKIDKIKTSIAKQTAEKIAVATRVSMRAVIKEEAINLSKAWRGDFAANDKYRNSSAELYADFLSGLLNNPAWVKKNFPNMHDAFFRALDNKPTVNKAYQQLNDLLNGGGMTDFLMDKVDKNYDESIDHLFALSKTKEKNAKLASETKLAKARRFFLNKWAAVTAKEGTILKGVEVDSYTSRLEANEGYAAKTRSLFNDSMRRQVTDPLKEAGVSTKDFSRFLLLNRIINDTTNTINEIKNDPETYRKVMVWMAEQFGASQYVVDVINHSSDANLYEAGAIMVRELKINKKLTPEIVAKVEARVANDGTEENAILEGAAEKIMAGFNIRGFMLNTEGLDVPTSIEGLEKMKADLGAEKWKAVKDSSAALFDLTTEITETAISLGLYAESTANEVIRPNAKNYIPFQVIEYFSGDVSAAIKKGKGSTKALNDSLTAISLHSQSLMGWIQRQQTVLMLEEWAKAYDVEVTDSGPITGRKRKLGNDKKDVVLVWRDGRPHELSFNEPGIAEAANYFEELTFITSIARTAGNFFGQMYTRYSPGFIMVTNPMRDFLTSAQGLGIRRSAKNYKAAFSIAKAYARVATGSASMTPEIRALVDRGILSPPEQSIFNQMTEPEMRDMLNAGLSARDVAHGRVKATDGSKLNLLKEFVDKPFTYAGAISESLPKIAASKSLAEMGFDEAEVTKISKLFGIPNPGLGGTGVQAMGAISLFYRVTIQGARMQRELLTNPKTRGGYFLRIAMIEMLPKVMMWAAQTGILATILKSIGIDPGDDLEMFYKNISSYKKENGTVIPIGWITPDGFKPAWGHSKDEIEDNWQAFGLRIPQSEAGRHFGGLTWNALAEMSDETRSSDPVRTWARFAGNQLPGVNPAIDVVSKNAQALMGINAIDSFRNRPIINYTDWNAGGIDRFKAMMKWNITQFASSWINLDSSVDVTGLSKGQKSIRKTAVVRSLFTFDNFASARERGLELSDNKRVTSRAKKALGNKTLELVNMGNRLEGIGVDGRSAAQQARYEIWLDYNRENWEGQKTGLMPNLKAAVADKNKKEIEEITEFLEAEAEITLGYIQSIK